MRSQTFDMDYFLSHRHSPSLEEYSDQYLKEAVCVSFGPEADSRLLSTLKKFNELSEKCLFLLRVETRCHCLYFLDFAIREVGLNYCISPS
jgi:hypothetical protein